VAALALALEDRLALRQHLGVDGQWTLLLFGVGGNRPAAGLVVVVGRRLLLLRQQFERRCGNGEDSGAGEHGYENE
jgi:hypothetical protein